MVEPARYLFSYLNRCPSFDLREMGVRSIEEHVVDIGTCAD